MKNATSQTFLTTYVKYQNFKVEILKTAISEGFTIVNACVFKLLQVQKRT